MDGAAVGRRVDGMRDWGNSIFAIIVIIHLFDIIDLFVLPSSIASTVVAPSEQSTVRESRD